MIFFKALLIVVEVLSCLLLIGLILLQRSKSEGLGLAFGAGAGEALFGARAGNVLSKITVILGVIFMACTLALGVMFAQKDRTLIDTIDPQPAPSAAMQTVPSDGMDMALPAMDSLPESTPLPDEPAAETM